MIYTEKTSRTRIIGVTALAGIVAASNGFVKKARRSHVPRFIGDEAASGPPSGAGENVVQVSLVLTAARRRRRAAPHDQRRPGAAVIPRLRWWNNSKGRSA
jgi:hypothetical protein